MKKSARSRISKKSNNTKIKKNNKTTLKDIKDRKNSKSDNKKIDKNLRARSKKLQPKKAKARSPSPNETPSKAKQKKAIPSAQTRKEMESYSFPIVGIGASAGGLEAFELFVSNIPNNSGMAYIIIQHQDPKHKSIVVDILRSHTLIPVYEIRENMKIEPNSIYFAPSGYNTSIKNSIFSLHKFDITTSTHLSIDYFFRSLAEDKGGQCAGVILSGMGSDGTFGMKAIKENGGGTFVQDPNTALFDSMPKNVIDEGIVDFVARVQDLPKKIVNYFEHFPKEKKINSSNWDNNSIDKILKLVQSEAGQDFSFYKKNTLYRRIDRRMGINQISNIKDYAKYLKENPQEVNFLFKELLIGVTRFFRDLYVWEVLKTEVLPEIFEKYPNGGTIRAWVPGCSTGEEAYTLAIIFKEALKELKNKNYNLQIFATDLNKDNILKARAGFFPSNITSDVSEERMKHYFAEFENGYRINKEIREMLIFAPQNITMDPPFTKLDIISCRNLLIYFDASAQKKLLNLFHYSLNPGGFLMLGTAETVGSSYIFSPYSGKARIFRRLETGRVLDHIDFPTSFPSYLHSEINSKVDMKNFSPNPKVLVESLILQIYSLPCILVTDQGDILFIHGKTGKYLEPASGKASLNIFTMAREGLKQALTESFQKAIRKKAILNLKNVMIKQNNDSINVDITIHPLVEYKEFTGMILVVFNEVKASTEIKKISFKAGKKNATIRLESLVSELQYCQRTLQSTRIEMQTSQEELRSSNEELQSTNEELQSSNEELTTSKEEMQSMNEELQTINNELQAKIDELSRTSNDMHNLLNSTDIGILFLDNDLKVRRFTNKITNIFKLIPSDIGRKITDIVSELNYPTLEQDSIEVLDTLVFKEKDILTKQNNNCYIVRIMPYKTLENRIDGVVFTFTDVTILKKLGRELEIKSTDLQKMIDNDKNL